MLPRPGVELKVPVMSGDYRFALIQMTGGIRLVGTAELSRLDAPPNYARAERLLKLGQRILPGLEGEGRTAWMGHRPSTPDSLPVICRAPSHRNAYFAFGHGHLGLTLAAATGRVIADAVAGREPPMNMDAFHVGRFRRFPWS
jgi:D-amino-acid dehydrogenase